MNSAARLLLPLAAVFVFAACANRNPKPSAKPAPVLGADALLPSSRLIVGRILSVDRTQGFAILETASDAPAAAIADGTELIARTADLRETGRLRSSRYLRGRTLGTTIVSGLPAPGDEVVWLAP